MTETKATSSGSFDSPPAHLTFAAKDPDLEGYHQVQSGLGTSSKEDHSFFQLDEVRGLYLARHRSGLNRVITYLKIKIRELLGDCDCRINLGWANENQAARARAHFSGLLTTQASLGEDEIRTAIGNKELTIHRYQSLLKDSAIVRSCNVNSASRIQLSEINLKDQEKRLEISTLWQAAGINTTLDEIATNEAFRTVYNMCVKQIYTDCLCIKEKAKVQRALADLAPILNIAAKDQNVAQALVEISVAIGQKQEDFFRGVANDMIADIASEATQLNLKLGVHTQTGPLRDLFAKVNPNVREAFLTYVAKEGIDSIRAKEDKLWKEFASRVIGTSFAETLSVCAVLAQQMKDGKFSDDMKDWRSLYRNQSNHDKVSSLAKAMPLVNLKPFFRALGSNSVELNQTGEILGKLVTKPPALSLRDEFTIVLRPRCIKGMEMGMNMYVDSFKKKDSEYEISDSHTPKIRITSSSPRGEKKGSGPQQAS